MTIIGTTIGGARAFRVSARRGSPALALAALFRKLVWRVLLLVSGGISRSGALPSGGCVVVANHNSHADTAALLATLPASARPVVVAAADYWFATPTRSLICRALVGGVPVRRQGGGRADLLRLAALARSGRTVVVFPEGTRSRDGELGEFHTGAFQLAESAGVPIVPVGIVGTRRLLAPSSRPRLTRIAVRIGTPLTSYSTDDARDAVTALVASGGNHAPDSSVRRRVATLAMSPLGLLLTASWAFAEALSLPIVTELVVVLAVLALPRAWWRLALAGAAGATAGAALGWLLAVQGITVPAPLTTARMRTTVAAQVAADGPKALLQQPVSGIPFKVYVAELGQQRAPLPNVLALSLPLRFVRLAAVALVAALFGVLGPRVAHLYPAVVVSVLAAFGVGLSRVVGTWQ